MEKKEFETITHEFDLNKDEIAAIADKVATKYADVKILESKFESMKKSQKGMIDSENDDIRILMEQIKTKKEKRNIDCEVVRDFANGVVQYYFRNSLGILVLIKERDMDRWEKQMHMDDMKRKLDVENKKKEIEKVVDEKIEKKLKDISATNAETEVKAEPEKTEEAQAQTETALSEPVEPENFDADTTQN